MRHGEVAASAFKKFIRFLTSRQFAVWSLLVLAVLLIIGGTLPDLTLLTEKESAQLKSLRPVLFWAGSHLQVQQLKSSPLFLILPGAIWLSIALCTFRRLKQRLPTRPSIPESGGADLPNAMTVSVSRPFGLALKSVKRKLRRRRWRIKEIQQNGSVGYFAQKGLHGFWGSLIFHMSMLVFLLGIIVSFLTRYDAEMVLAEGQTLPFADAQMLRINKRGILSPPLPETRMTLEKFESRFAKDKYPVDFAAYVNLSDEAKLAHEGVVRVNHSLVFDRWRIFLHRYGYAPRFRIQDERGDTVFDYFVNLVVSHPGLMDYFEIPSRRARIEARFFPEYVNDGENAISLSKVPRNPVMRVRLLENGDFIGEDDLPLGGTARLGKYRLTFADLRNWAWFGVVHDPGYGFIVTGFLFCVAGLALRFLFVEKRLHVKVERQAGPSVLVTLAGRSRYFPAVFQKEIEDICLQLQAESDVALEPERGCVL